MKIDDIVAQMKMVGNKLVPYNVPETESEVYALKTRDAIIQGYDVVLYYTKSRFDNYYCEIFQIYGKNITFLPFFFVSNLAKKYLGDKNLNLVELIKNNRKIYSWSSYLDLDGNSIVCPYSHDFERCTFEDWKYNYVQPNQVSFY